MDAATLHQLNTLGIPIPTAWYLFWSLIFSIIGIAAFRYGRKWKERPIMWTGVVLMLYSYVITDDVWMFVTGVGLCGLIFYFYKIT